MTARKIALLVAAAGLFAPALAFAQIVTKPVEEKKLATGKQKLDPAKGYVFFHAPTRQTLMLIKTPSDEQRTAFETEWRTKLDKEKKRYPRRLKAWQDDVELAKKMPDYRVPQKPVEPTEENYSIGNIETRMIVSVGPQYVFAKDDGDFSYLQEVEPGTYTYYGPVFYAPNGTAGGTCYCMGSVKFEVVAGKVTNLGDFPAMGWVELTDADRKANPALANWQSKPVDYTLPASLSSFGAEQADFHAAGKMNNFFGILIGRIPPVPGVLAYRRDTVIDLKAAPENAAE